MSNKQELTHDELQHIEHCNKIMRDHLELVQKVTGEVQKTFDLYLPHLQDYVGTLRAIQFEFGRIVVDIIRSSRELKLITSGSQELHNYGQAATKLNQALSDELVQKIIKLTKEDKQ